MKTVIIILLSTLTCFTQKESHHYWFKSVLDQCSFLVLTEELELTSDYIQMDVANGDRVSLWNNSGIVLFDHEFSQDRSFQLHVDHFLYGQYHLGVKKAGSTGVWTTLHIGKEGLKVVDLSAE